jgi:hypothetical protein
MHLTRFLRTSWVLSSLAMLSTLPACVHRQHEETVRVQQAHGGGPFRGAERGVKCLARGVSLRGCE